MAKPNDTPSEGKNWWKQANVLLGVGGVLATIIVGVVTYLLTSGSVSREYQERIRAGRNDVLVSVSKSIGEGVVPNKDQIQSVINSVRRQYDIKEGEFVTPETIIEDVVARVLANEFLDAKRREELAGKLMSAKGTSPQVVSSDQQPRTAFKDADARTAFAVALAAASMAALVVGYMGERFKRILRVARERGEPMSYSARRLEFLYRQIIYVLLMLVAIVVSMWVLFTMLGSDFMSFLTK
jgi:hypothetical protein